MNKLMESFYLITILGIDLQGMLEMGQTLAQHNDIARKCRALENKIKDYQDSFTAIEKVSLFTWNCNIHYRSLIFHYTSHIFNMMLFCINKVMIQS